MSILRQHGAHVADMEDSFGYKVEGTHFLVSRECGSTKTVRLITDSRISTTGNFFIEVAHHRYKDETKQGKYQYEKGWFLKDTADILMVYDCVQKILYGLNFRALQYNIQTTNIPFKPNRIDKNCDTAFRLISLRKCKQMGAIYFRWSGIIPKKEA